jgi:hypothetical protein
MFYGYGLPRLAPPYNISVALLWKATSCFGCSIKLFVFPRFREARSRRHRRSQGDTTGGLPRARARERDSPGAAAAAD